MFKRFLGINTSKPDKELPPLPGGIINAILQTIGGKGIPAMPGAAQKAFQLSIDPNAEARDFIEVVESDEGLSARIIKIANSVFFDRGKASTTIEESVVTIGLNEMRSLLSATTLAEIFPSTNPMRSGIWAHDVAVGLFSRHLARRLHPESVELAFLGGLMHDIGKLLLIQRASDVYSKVWKKVESSGCMFSDAERELFIFDHTEVSHLIADRWSFGLELTTILRTHHRAVEPQDIHPTNPVALSTIVKGADLIAHALGIGCTEKLYKLRESAEAQLKELWPVLRVQPEKERETLEQCKKLFESEYELYAGNQR